jgi:hypothetical protein
MRVLELATGHDPMVSAPADLARLLVDCSGRGSANFRDGGQSQQQ